MKTTRILTTVATAAALVGGIGLAYAQNNETTQTPAMPPATSMQGSTPRTSLATDPNAGSANGSNGSSMSNSSNGMGGANSTTSASTPSDSSTMTTPSSTEPAPKADRG